MAIGDCNDPNVTLAWLQDRLELTDADGRYSSIPWDGIIEQADLPERDINDARSPPSSTPTTPTRSAAR